MAATGKARDQIQGNPPCECMIFSVPLGYAALVYRITPFALLETFLPMLEDKKLFVKIQKSYSCEIGSNKKAKKVSDSMAAYLKGISPKISWPPWEWMDMGSLTPLEVMVLKKTAGIPYGEIRTYREIAEAIRRPRAYRFVGNTLAKNPFPILIPCHRVFRSNLEPGGFGGGTELKRELVKLEQSHPLT
ncbi:MAG: MGMT family protein [Thermodesulfobacteriota bacterium]